MESHKEYVKPTITAMQSISGIPLPTPELIDAQVETLVKARRVNEAEVERLQLVIDKLQAIARALRQP